MRKKYVTIGVIAVLSAVLAYLQFVQARCNADDAGTYVYMYSLFELGNKTLDIRTILNPWFYCAAVSYLLNIGGNGAFSSQAYLAAWYGMAVFFTFLLVMHKRDSKWLLALALFILLPYGNTNDYHMVAAFVTLFGIWLLQCYKETGKKWICFSGALAVIFFGDKKEHAAKRLLLGILEEFEVPFEFLGNS